MFKNVQDVKTRSFADLVASSPESVSSGHRGIYQTHPFSEYNKAYLDAVTNETTFWGAQLQNKTKGNIITHAVDPFLPDILSHNKVQTAYPYDRSRVALPSNMYFSWDDPADDQFMHDAIVQSQASLVSKFPESAPLYPNYAVYDTPVQDIYGSNLDKLKAIKRKVDPNNVMGLAGGFKL